MKNPGNSNSNINPLFNNPVVGVKVLDKDVLIGRLIAEIATLRAFKPKSEYLVAQERRFNPTPVSVAFMEKHVLGLIASNNRLAEASLRLLDLVIKKKVADYWDDLVLIGLKIAIDDALKANKKYISVDKQK